MNHELAQSIWPAGEGTSLAWLSFVPRQKYFQFWSYSSIIITIICLLKLFWSAFQTISNLRNFKGVGPLTINVSCLSVCLVSLYTWIFLANLSLTKTVEKLLILVLYLKSHWYFNWESKRYMNRNILSSVLSSCFGKLIFSVRVCVSWTEINKLSVSPLALIDT